MKLDKTNLCDNRLWVTQIPRVRSDLERNLFATISVPGIGSEQFLQLSYYFGEVIKAGRETPLVTEMRTDLNASDQELQLHNDKTYWRVPPRYELLYIVEAEGMSGGEIIKSSLIDAYATLTGAEQRLLRETDVLITAPPNRDQGTLSAPLVNCVNGRLAFFRCRMDIIKPPQEIVQIVGRWYAAIQGNAVAYPSRTGDLFIFDNWLAAHGRRHSTFRKNGFRIAYRTLVI